MTLKISEAEWQVMKILWHKSPRTSNEIISILEHNVGWSAPTIRTLITRLLNKGAINFKKNGRAYLYSYAIQEEQIKRTETKSFISRVFDGTMQPLFVTFLKETDLSNAEIVELERILREKKLKR